MAALERRLKVIRLAQRRQLPLFALALLLTLAVLSGCGDVQPEQTAQSLGNAANTSMRASAATPVPTATKTPRPKATATGTSTSSDSSQTSNGCAITSQQTQAELYLLNRLNQHRKDGGVQVLTLSTKLSAVSRAHSCDMYQHQKLNHNGSDGSTLTQRILAVGIQAHTWGENIGTASGFGLDGGIDANDNDMMAEPLQQGNHRWNIMNASYSQVGIGIIYINGQEWMTEDFIG
ncbi:MAG TPA: CAP domain-containing protein [Ktedonobacterales bacterium]|nr:CAP domain-containing protein [Ktedonobacterales bacterium]